jgi:hypothetical protein
MRKKKCSESINYSGAMEDIRHRRSKKEKIKTKQLRIRKSRQP